MKTNWVSRVLLSYRLYVGVCVQKPVPRTPTKTLSPKKTKCCGEYTNIEDEHTPGSEKVCFWVFFIFCMYSITVESENQLAAILLFWLGSLVSERINTNLNRVMFLADMSYHSTPCLCFICLIGLKIREREQIEDEAITSTITCQRLSSPGEGRRPKDREEG